MNAGNSHNLIALLQAALEVFGFFGFLRLRADLKERNKTLQ